MSIALLFPGQGSQFIGMGKDFYDAFETARNTIHEVEDAIDTKLTTLMFEGPDSALNLTENTQPALMAISLAIQRVLAIDGQFGPEHDHVLALAGHSLGEYSALTAAGSLTLPTAARLLKIRGIAMQDAVPEGQGAMAAIIGLDIAALTQIIAMTPLYDQICAIANDNCPGQIVISGHVDAVAAVSKAAVEAGARKAVPLPVSAPFHCKLMQPAAQKMESVLQETILSKPIKPIVMNISAQPERDPAVLKAGLVTQVTEQVRWTESMRYLCDVQKVDTFIEIGAGKVLTGLMKRISKEANLHTINTVNSLDTFLSTR